MMMRILLACMLMTAPPGAEEAIFAIGEWPPYVNGQARDGGSARAIVTAACTAAGLVPVFRHRPWARAEREVLAGEALGTFPFQRVRDDADFIYSAPLLHGTWRIFIHTGNPATPAGMAFASLGDLHRLRIADVLGYPRIHDDLVQARSITDATPDMDSAFRKLIARRIDAVIEDEAVGLAVLARLDPDGRSGVRPLGSPYRSTSDCTYLIKVARANPHAERLLKRIDAGLAAIRADGRYQRIMDDHQATTGRSAP